MLSLSLLSLAQPSTQTVLCPNSDGAIIGLASDNSYYVRPPSDGATNPERWTRVQENHAQPQTGPINSFTGSFMQVLPDDRDSYHQITGDSSFTMTGLDFAFRVTTPGLYTLFLRWTGGDTVGGGDSLYAVVRRSGSDSIMTGPDVYKPQRIPIDQNPGQFTGCCYNPTTHACPCYTPAMDPSNDGSACSTAGGHWVPIAQTARWHPTCEDVNGQQQLIQSPRWYLYAGQAAGNVMDFASEPWDSTCEAEGTGTADTGLNHAQWNLSPGEYHIVFYPREDGTAVDAFYLAPPGCLAHGDDNPDGGRVDSLCWGEHVAVASEAAAVASSAAAVASAAVASSAAAAVASAAVASASARLAARRLTKASGSAIAACHRHRRLRHPAILAPWTMVAPSFGLTLVGLLLGGVLSCVFVHLRLRSGRTPAVGGEGRDARADGAGGSLAR